MNKGCYLPPGKYIVILSVPDHTCYLVRRVTPPCTHPLWCDDMHSYGAYVYFPTQGRLFFLPKPYFPRTMAHHLHSIVYKNPQYTLLLPEILLQSLVLFHADGSIF